MENLGRIQSFEDLETWKKGHLFVLEIYKNTKTFPKEELFCLTQQMRRAAVSITSNIAEGFSRKSAKEKLQFYHISLGSLTELQNQLIISKDIGYLSEKDFIEMEKIGTTVNKLLHGLIKKVSSPPTNPNTA